MTLPDRPALPPLYTLGLPRGDDPNELDRQQHISCTQMYWQSPISSVAPQNPPLPVPPPVPLPAPMPVHPPVFVSAPLVAPVPVRLPAPLPVPLPAPLRASPPSSSTPPPPTRKIRLTPTSYENAEAVVLISPPPAPNAPRPRPLLLVGPALQRLRRGERRVEQGTVVLPYRVTRGIPDHGPPAEPSYRAT